MPAKLYGFFIYWRFRCVAVLVLEDNELVGSMPEEVCALRLEAVLSELTVDCEEVECTCCTNCGTPLPSVGPLPSQSPSTSHPTQVPTISLVPSSAPTRVGDALLEILEPVVPNVDLLFAPLTAQATAFNFLRSTDGVLMFSDREIRQRYALSVLFVTTRGFFWTDTDNWLSQDLTVCEWQWVECDGEILRALHLGGRNIVGELPPDLSVLKETCESDEV